MAGNAVNAKWIGPSGHQLYDGTLLEPGMLIEGIGYDEASDNPYWQVVGPYNPDKSPKDSVTDVTDNRVDPDQQAKLEAEAAADAPTQVQAPAPTTTTDTGKGAAS